MNREGKKCVLYPRVSTEMQVDGYSLEGQKNSLKRFAFLAEMEGDRIFVRSDSPDGFCTVRICFCERSDCRVTTATFYEVHYSFFVNLSFGHFSHTLII